MIKYINSIQINTADMPDSQNVRNLTITGDTGAVFSVHVMQNQNKVIKFYNFIDTTWDSDFKAANKLSNIKIAGSSYSKNITFEAISSNAATYTIFVHAEPHFNTKLAESVSPENEVCYTTTINQVLDATVSLYIKSGSESSYVTSSISEDVKVDSTGSTVQTNVVTLIPSSFTWEPTNALTDANGFGLILSRQPTANDWAFREIDTVDGAISSTNSFKVDSLTNLGVGMKIVGVSSGSLSGTPNITEIDTNTKTLTISSNQTFADGIVLTFEGRGSDVINKATGAIINFSAIAKYKTQLTKTVRLAVSNSTTITLNGTYGVAKGATVRGVGMDNSSANAVQSISAAVEGGSIVVQANQTLTAGSKLYIDGCAKVIVIEPTVKIHKYPANNISLYLLIDGFITPGVGS